MAYLNTITGQYPVSEQDIRQQNPNTSYANPFAPDETFVNVFPSPQPQYNSLSQILVEGQPQKSVDGWYEQTWNIVDLDPTIVTQNTETKRKQILLSQISVLENQVTQRRLREAVLGIDNGWLQNINKQISDLRVQL